MDFLPPNSIQHIRRKEIAEKRAKARVPGSLTPDFIRPASSKKAKNSTESEGSSPVSPNTGEKRYPTDSVLRRIADKTGKELEEMLGDFGFTAEDIRKNFPRKDDKFREVAHWLAEQEDSYQDTPPKGWES